MITIEQIKERLARLDKDRTELIARLNVYDGAIQECEFWLKVAEETKEE